MHNSSAQRPDAAFKESDTDVAAISENDVRLHLHRALGLQADASPSQVYNASMASAYYRYNAHRRRRASRHGESGSSSTSSRSHSGRSSRSSGDDGNRRSRRSSGSSSSSSKKHSFDERRGPIGDGRSRQRQRSPRGGNRSLASAQNQSTTSFLSRSMAHKTYQQCVEHDIPMQDVLPSGASGSPHVRPFDASNVMVNAGRAHAKGKKRRANRSLPRGDGPSAPVDHRGGFAAYVLAARFVEDGMPRVRGAAAAATAAAAAASASSQSRFLFRRCLTVEALLEALGQVTAVVQPASSSASSSPALHLDLFAREEGRCFLWIDLHGVPSTEEEVGEEGLTALWRLLGLAPRHVQQMEHVADSFRHVTRQQKREKKQQRQHSPASVAAAARASGCLDDRDGSSTTHTARAAPLSSSSSSSSTSSSSSSDSSEEENTFHALAVGDMYLEDLRMTQPDTVQICRVQPVLASQAAAAEARPGDGAYYTLTELAALTQETWTKPEAKAHAQRRHEHTETAFSLDALHVFQHSEDERLLDEEEVSTMAHEVAPDASIPLYSPESVERGQAARLHAVSREAADDEAEKGKRRSQRGPSRSRPPSASGSSSSSSSSSASSSSSSSGYRRQVQRYGDYGDSAPEPPTITSTFLVAFPNVCVTWCPASTYGSKATTSGRAQQSLVRTRSVMDWRRLQEAALARMRGVGANEQQHQQSFSMLTTAQFASLLLATVCYAYLPDTTAVLNEVDAIDAMLPLIVPDRESDQADALRRVLVLRRRLAVHRRLLYQKMRLLEELQRPAMRTLVSFMSGSNRTWGSDGGGRAACSPVSPLTAVPPSPTSASAPTAVEGGPTASLPAGTFASTRTAIEQALRKLDGARTVLGNTTLIYSSAVTSRNYKASNETDFFQLALQYLYLTVLPLTIVVSLWGMNCHVPWRHDPSLRPFFGIVGVLVALSVVGLSYPIYALKSGRPELMT